jgi:DNA-binding LytR/AlgR family response regulator
MPIFFQNNKAVQWQFALVWLGFSLIQTVAIFPLWLGSFWWLFSDLLLQSALNSFMVLVLWLGLRFGRYQLLQPNQRLINYLALSTVAILMRVGFAYAIWQLYDERLLKELYPFALLYLLISILLVFLAFLFYQVKMNQMQELEEINNTEPKESKMPQPPNASEIIEHVAVKSGNKIAIIKLSEILYIQADGDYISIVTQDRRYLKEQTMKSIEASLPESEFVRIHRSCIVNIHAISRIELYEKQTQMLSLNNGQQVKMSPSGYKILRQRLNI